MRDNDKAVDTPSMPLAFGSGRLVRDEELERLAEDAGPASVAAAMVRERRICRARHRHVRLRQRMDVGEGNDEFKRARAKVVAAESAGQGCTVREPAASVGSAWRR